MADQRTVPLYLVGGVVRDLLLRRPTWDLDLAVEGDGPGFARTLADDLHAGLVVFERFATARLTMKDGTKIDVASTRRESYAEPAALPDVSPAPLSADLYRRDFTINAMAIQLNADRFGRLHDPYGGQRDLRSRTIRALHNESFIDDPTRIFRAVRFAQRFGFRLETNTARLLRQAAATDQVARLSGPRLCNEILLLLEEPDPLGAMARLARLDLLRFLHPLLKFGGSASAVMAMVPRAVRWWIPYGRRRSIAVRITMLMALLHRAEPAVVQQIIRRLMLSKEQAEKVRWAGLPIRCAARRLASARPLKPSSIYRELVHLPSEAHILLLAHSMSRGGQAGLARVKSRLKAFLTTMRDGRSPLRGEDLLRMGLTPGPQFGRILDRVREAQLDGTVKTKMQARRLAQSLANLPA